MDPTKLYQYIRRRIAYEEKRIRETTPAEYRSLKELLEEKRPCITLQSGVEHCIDKEELKELARIVPWYLHRLVKLPIVLVYSKIGSKSFFRVRGDRWSCYTVGILLKGRLWHCLETIDVEAAYKLLKRFKTVFLVTIELELSGLG
ncbi:MAG TPA: DUF61 family protein [Pyrodictium sp.]|nr:DUF61 family protein [Pyrodictium sp.]